MDKKFYVLFLSKIVIENVFVEDEIEAKEVKHRPKIV